VGGSVNYTGAPTLAAEASYRIGAGLVTVAAPASILPVIGAHLLEATYVVLPHDLGVIASAGAKIVRDEAAKYDALLVGPGIGREKTTGEMLGALLDPTGSKKDGARRPIGFGGSKSDTPESKAAQQSELPPLVIDADGLYHLSQRETWWTLLPPNTILTPHPGEMSQLTGMETATIQKDRWTIAATKAAEWNVILVLKGAHTLIAEPGGRVVVLPFKTAALATAGTGDVLAGMIVGLLAQGLQPFDAAVAAGYIHGLAGKQMEMLVGTRGCTAGDIVRFGVPQALRLLEMR
jgi:ADP-dependent NAD(P)H-hydrate dehydratase / NAD(P)H-hydrate epimerase